MPDTVASSRRNPLVQRAVDVVLATVTLLLLLPLMLLITLAILISSGRPVLFSQERLGRGGVPFRLHKFRTLEPVEHGESIAPINDARTTPVGRLLRRCHLDELPQLFEVLRGKMALVGPRPEVPANLVAITPEDLTRVQTVLPGITGPTQLAFVAEDDVLAECNDALHAYRHVLVPAKLAHDLTWLQRRTLLSDLGVLLSTPFRLLSRRARAASRVRVVELLGRLSGRPSGRPRH